MDRFRMTKQPYSPMKRQISLGSFTSANPFLVTPKSIPEFVIPPKPRTLKQGNFQPPTGGRGAVSTGEDKAETQSLGSPCRSSSISKRVYFKKSKEDGWDGWIPNIWGFADRCQGNRKVHQKSKQRDTSDTSASPFSRFYVPDDSLPGPSSETYTGGVDVSLYHREMAESEVRKAEASSESSSMAADKQRETFGKVKFACTREKAQNVIKWSKSVAHSSRSRGFGSAGEDETKEQLRTASSSSALGHAFATFPDAYDSPTDRDMYSSAGGIQHTPEQRRVQLPNIMISRHQSKKMKKRPKRASIVRHMQYHYHTRQSRDGSISSGSPPINMYMRRRSFADTLKGRDYMHRRSSRFRRRSLDDSLCNCGRVNTSDSDELRNQVNTKQLEAKKDLIKMSLSSSLNMFLNIPHMSQTKARQGCAGSSFHSADASGLGSPSGFLSPRGSLTPKSNNSPCSSNCSSRKSSFGDLGDIKVGLLYMADAENVTLKVIKARNVGGIFKTTQKEQLRIYCKVCLVPGKQQKQQTKDVMGSQDPVFKEAFLFKGLTKANLEKCKLRVRVYNRCSRLRRDEFLGESTFSLLNLPDNEMFKQWSDLTPKSGIENLGSLTVSVCLEKNAGILTVNVVKGKDLPRNLITGSPDPYVKVLVVQESRAVLMKRTKIKRKTTCPVFKEVFTFHVSTTPEDISHTAVEFTVYDRTRIWSDDVIGQVKLGSSATEENEMKHWDEIVDVSPPQPITATHDIMEPDETMYLPHQPGTTYL